MSATNLMALRYIKEVTYGTTPATPALSVVRYTGESLTYGIENVVSNEIRSDRNQTALIQSSAQSSGDIQFEFSYASFDDFIAGALASTWSGTTVKTIKNGTTKTGLTLQKHFTDLTTPDYHTYRGCVVNTMGLSFKVGEIVTGSFGLLGLGMTRSTTQIAGATFPAATTSSPLSAVANLGSIQIDDVPYTGCVNAVTINTTNNYRPNQCVGSLAPSIMVQGQFEITGSLEAYFSEVSLLDKFLSAGSFKLYVPTTVGAKSVNITVPAAKFETAEVVAGGKDQDVMFSATFRGLYSAADVASIVVVFNDA